MSAPQLTVYANGPNAVGGDQLNTFMQTCDTALDMRGFIGGTGVSLFARGIAAPGDGAGGPFYWNSTAIGPDDDLNTIVPFGAKVGAWVRLPLQKVSVAPIANIAALRAATIVTVPSDLCYVEGYYAGADGGEGVFWHAPADTTSADNGGTVIIDASNRRWYRETVKSASEWSVMWFGAQQSLADNTAIINSAIVTLGAAGGGILTIPAGTFVFTGTIFIAVNNICLRGAGRLATTLQFANGNVNCISVGSVFTTVISTPRLLDLNVSGSAKTGGYGLALFSTAGAIIRGCQFSNMSAGIYVQFNNNDLIQDCIILCQNASGYDSAIKWFCVADASQSGQVLCLTNVTINCFGNAQGILIDGPANTLRIQACGVIHAINGLLVQNTQGSNNLFPEFIFADDLEIDGVITSCVNIQAGRRFQFSNCSFFNNFGGETSDTDVIQIASDGAHSVTSGIWFDNCTIGGAQTNGVYCVAKNVSFSNCYIGDNAVAGAGAGSGILLGNDGGTNGAAAQVLISNCQIGSVFGDLNNQAWGVIVAAGCTQVTVSNSNFVNNVTGAIQDNTGAAGNVMWHGCIDINGVQLPDRLPVLPADTGSPVNGVLYYNATTATLRTYLNGVLKTVTTS